MRIRLHKRRDIYLDYAPVINFSIPDECDTLRIGKMTGDLTLNLTDEGAGDGDYFKLLVEADGTLRTLTIAGPQGAPASASLTNGGAVVYFVFHKGLGQYISVVAPGSSSGGAAWPLNGVGTLTGDVTIDAAGKNLTLGSAASKIAGFEMNITGDYDIKFGQGNVVFGKNINVNAPANYFECWAFGSDHTILAEAGSGLAWNLIMGELGSTLARAGAGIGDTAILGGSANTVESSGSGTQVYFIGMLAGYNNKVEGLTSYVFGSSVTGIGNYISNGCAWASGSNVRITGMGGFGHGFLTDQDFYGGSPSPKVLIAGIHGINMSANTPAQTAGHGVLADFAAIIGGVNGHIPADSPRSVILGGNLIKARAAAPDQVYVPGLNIMSAMVLDNTLTEVMVRNPVTGQIKSRTIALVAERVLEITNPTGAENRTLLFTPKEITIAQIDDVVVGLTPSVSWNINFAPTRNGVPTLLFNVDRTTNSEAGSSTATFDNPVIPAGSWVWLTTSAMSGTVNSLDIQVSF